MGSEHGSSREYAEERFLGLAMGAYGLEPFPSTFRHLWRKEQWINEANGAHDYQIDIVKGKCTYYFGRKSHAESPMIVHFNNGLKPKDIYIRESKALRNLFGVSSDALQSI